MAPAAIPWDGKGVTPSRPAHRKVLRVPRSILHGHGPWARRKDRTCPFRLAFCSCTGYAGFAGRAARVAGGRIKRRIQGS